MAYLSLHDVEESWNEATEQLAFWDEHKLHSFRKDLQFLIRVHREEVKRFTWMDHEFWSSRGKLIGYEKQHVVADSCYDFLCWKNDHPDTPDDEWDEEDTAVRLKSRFIALLQQEHIVNKQAIEVNVRRIDKSIRAKHEEKFRDPSTIPSFAETTVAHQQSFYAAMMRAYCLRPPTNNAKWDPVLGAWREEGGATAVYLYPWRQADWMDAIFGEGADSEVFSPLNGLFLHTNIKYALDTGVLALVPDVDIQPDDQAQQRERIQRWESAEVKEYKTIVMDPSHKDIETPIFLGVPNVQSLMDLHDRKLHFLDDNRPDAKYIWWTYLNAIMRLNWAGREIREIREAARHWPVRGRYINESQLLGCLKEIGHDVEGILDHAIVEREHEEPAVEGVVALANEAAGQASRAERLLEHGGEAVDSDDWIDATKKISDW